MCGRYTARFTETTRLPENLAWLIPRFAPCYNIAPQQKAPVIRLSEGKPVCEEIMWGFRPSWMKDRNKVQINARAETLFEKPMFRDSALHRRCLVLANGWYEWQKQPDGKQPYRFHLQSDELFTFAGIWTRWHTQGEEQQDSDSYAIVTTEANTLSTPIHNRMPAVLSEHACETWMDVDHSEPVKLGALLRPYSGSDLRAYRVNTAVNSTRNDSEDCIRPMAH